MADPTPDTTQAGPGQSPKPGAPVTSAPLVQPNRPAGAAVGAPSAASQGGSPQSAQSQNQQVNRPRITITNPAPTEEVPPAPVKEPDNLSAATRAEMEAGKAALERRK